MSKKIMKIGKCTKVVVIDEKPTVSFDNKTQECRDMKKAILEAMVETGITEYDMTETLPTLITTTSPRPGRPTTPSFTLGEEKKEAEPIPAPLPPPEEEESAEEETEEEQPQILPVMETTVTKPAKRKRKRSK